MSAKSAGIDCLTLFIVILLAMYVVPARVTRRARIKSYAFPDVLRAEFRESALALIQAWE